MEGRKQIQQMPLMMIQHHQTIDEWPLQQVWPLSQEELPHLVGRLSAASETNREESEVWTFAAEPFLPMIKSPSPQQLCENVDLPHRNHQQSQKKQMTTPFYQRLQLKSQRADEGEREDQKLRTKFHRSSKTTQKSLHRLKRKTTQQVVRGLGSSGNDEKTLQRPSRSFQTGRHC